jgi:ribonuclease-3 family protein
VEDVERKLSDLEMIPAELGIDHEKCQGGINNSSIDWMPEMTLAGCRDVENLNPLVLAYLGDAVYELFVRCGLVARGYTRVGLLHQEATNLVRATCQARFLHEIEGSLTEEEIRVMKRGRNAKSGHVPRSAEVVEYRWSTGFESLIGYLYLKGRFERLEEILVDLPWPGTSHGGTER